MSSLSDLFAELSPFEGSLCTPPQFTLSQDRIKLLTKNENVVIACSDPAGRLARY